MYEKENELKMVNIAIVGSGFRGIFDALLLSENKENKITIFDNSSEFGGISRSKQFLGFNVDMGVHMFDSVQVELYELVNEIMDGAMHKIDFVSQSSYQNNVTDGYSLPDLSSESYSVKNQITNELINLASNPEMSSNHIFNSKTLDELFQNRYGKTAGGIFSRIFEKVYNIPAKSCDKNALNRTSLGRLKYLDDNKMMVLKSNEYLDGILAARRRSVGKVDNYVSGYPSDGKAMGGFCDRVRDLLSKKNVEIILGQNIKLSIENKKIRVLQQKSQITREFDHLFWAADNLNPLLRDLSINHDLDKYVYKTPMLFAIMKTDLNKIKPFTYMQNFSQNGLTYRTSAAGLYSNQTTDDKNSFITAECPCKLDDFNHLEDKVIAKKIWDEIKKLRIVQKNASLNDFKILRVASSFKVPTKGFTENYDLIQNILNNFSNKISTHSLKLFFRRELYEESKELTKPFL